MEFWALIANLTLFFFIVTSSSCYTARICVYFDISGTTYCRRMKLIFYMHSRGNQDLSALPIKARAENHFLRVFGITRRQGNIT